MAVIGAGSIGTGWAIVFAAAGFAVRLQDTDARPARRRAGGGHGTARRSRRLRPAGRARRRGRRPDRVGRASLEAAVAGAAHVQECVPEQLELKRRLFARLDELAPADCPIASSSSFMPASPPRRRSARPRPLPRRPPWQPALPAARGRGGAGAVHRGRDGRAHRGPAAARRHRAGAGRRARSRASSSTGSRVPCCARPTAWCATASPRSPTSTASCATAWACAGRRSARSRPSTSTPAAASPPTPSGWARPTPGWARSAARTTPGPRSWWPRSRRSGGPSCDLADWGERVAWRDRLLMALLRARATAEP